MVGTKISIIVPIYNAEKTLERCLSCLCAQTYENIEILLIEDGSVDDSLSIEYQLAAEDHRILVVENKVNQDLIHARQVGIKNASGDYIGFVDADDWVESVMYEVLYREIVICGADVSSCGIQKDYPDGTVKYNFQIDSKKIFSPEDEIKNINNERNLEVFLACKLIKKKGVSQHMGW